VSAAPHWRQNWFDTGCSWLQEKQRTWGSVLAPQCTQNLEPELVAFPQRGQSNAGMPAS
jgi:hypothetical protein